VHELLALFSERGNEALLPQLPGQPYLYKMHLGYYLQAFLRFTFQPFIL
jgi:hypothetical protein